MTAIIDSFVDPPTAVLVACGELDLALRDDLRTRLVELGAVEGATLLHLDLGGVTFIDCVCLRELDRARRAWDAAGRRFEMIAASAAVRRIAEYARYHELVGLPAPRVGRTAAAARWS